MTDSLYAWSLTADDNGNADAEINFLENQLPSTVNNSNRALMRRIKQLLLDLAPNRTSTGTSAAYAVTAASPGATYRDGEVLTFIPHVSNSAGCTLNVNARGAKPWRAAPGVDFQSGNILAGVPVQTYYRSVTDEWVSPGTGYYVSNSASGVALQSITARLPQIGDMVVSYAPTPGPGRIRLGEAIQSLAKSAWPELNSYLSSIAYPWGSTATHFSLPPAAGYFLRFAGSTTTIDPGGPRTAGSTQVDTLKSHAHTASTTVAAGGAVTPSGGFYTLNLASGVSAAVPGGIGPSGPSYPNAFNLNTIPAHTHTAATTVDPTGDVETRPKNVAFHLDIVASTALAAAQVAAFGFPYQWDSGTASAHAGVGRIRGNNASLALITELYVSYADGFGVDMSALLAGLDAGTAINLSKVGAQANRATFTVTGVPTAGAFYYIIPVGALVVGGSLTNDDRLALEVSGGGIGPTGPTGPNAGLDYAWSTAAAGDPGAGNVLANNAALASATAIHISKTGRNGENLGAVIGLWDDSTSTVKGHLRIFSTADRTEWIEANVTSIADNTTYWAVSITSVSAGNAPGAGDVMAVVFEAKGDKGDAGGMTGPGTVVDNAVPRWDGATGTLLQSSGWAIDDADKLSIKGQGMLYHPDQTGVTGIGSLWIGSTGSPDLLWTTALQTYYNLGVGSRCLTKLTTGSYNVGVGFEVMEEATTASFNTGIGEAALIYLTTGLGNVAVGWKALLGIAPQPVTGAVNNGVGLIRLTVATTAGWVTGNTAVVAGVGGVPAATGSWVITVISATQIDLQGSAFAGAFTSGGTARVSITGNYNTGVGYNALAVITTGIENTALGKTAGVKITTGSYNTTLGSNAGAALTTGVRNVALGSSSLLAASTADDQMAIGYLALNSSNGNNNLGIGFAAGYTITSGISNLAIGYQCQTGITTGSYNTIIGTVNGLSPTLSSTLVLADGGGGIKLVGTAAGVIGIGGLTAAFGGLKQTGGVVSARLADDSADTAFQATEFRVAGVKVIGARATGYTNAMTGTANRATAYATSTITLVQLAERMKAIEDDLLAHGMIGA